jgi:LSD1 subclass zinc finger protein
LSKHEGAIGQACGTISRVMPVNPELLKILVCPLCKTPVELTEGGQGLKCTQCRRVYPIRDDIPVMLISEAKVEN